MDKNFNKPENAGLLSISLEALSKILPINGNEVKRHVVLVPMTEAGEIAWLTNIPANLPHLTAYHELLE